MELLEIKLSFFPLLLGQPFKHGIMLDTNTATFRLLFIFLGRDADGQIGENWKI